MFRPLRRTKNEVSKEQAYKYLEDTKEGFLSTISVDNGYPYGLAVNHVYLNGKIYFHCAKKGHKLDNILANDKVSFFTIHKNEIWQEAYTTVFESVHVFGRASIVTDKLEYKDALMEISRKYTGKFFASAKTKIASALDITEIVKIDIEHISGKKTKVPS